MAEDYPPNSPIAQLTERSRRQQRARRFRGGGQLPPIEYPAPADVDEMDDEEIHEWYQEHHPLPDAEYAKYQAVTTIHDEALGASEPADRDVRVIMNAFYADPDDPVDVAELLEELGLPCKFLDGVDWDAVDVDEPGSTQELLEDLEVI